MKKYIFIFIIFFIIWFTIWNRARADEWNIIIWCLNQETLETRVPNNNWNCLYWQGWQNIMIPPYSHIKLWRKVFDNDRQIINRLPIVNFESWFDVNAENPFAIWYVQTLKRWGVDREILPQLEWMKKRQDVQWNRFMAWKYWRIRACGFYWDSYNYVDRFPAWEEWVISCLYRWHYHANTGRWYARKLMKARAYYIEYFEKNWFYLVNK